MTLLTRLLELCYITSSIGRDSFDEVELEKLARHILKAKGVINPIIVEQIATLEFSVVKGDFEFYSAIKASEIDSTFEEIQVLILPKDKSTEEGIINQVKILRNGEKIIDSSVKQLLDDLEKRSHDRFSQLEDKITSSTPAKLDLSAIDEIISKQGQRIISDFDKRLLDRLSTIDTKIDNMEKRLTNIEEKLSKPKPPPRRVKKIPALPINISTATLDQLISIPGISDARAKLIISSPPNSFDELFSILKGASKQNKEDWQRSFVFQ